VFVTVWPPRTAKDAAVPRRGAVAALLMAEKRRADAIVLVNIIPSFPNSMP
jgi:hypothetical protein